MKVLRKARLAECCGQHYCHSCLDQWFRSNPQIICPYCRSTNFQHVLNKEKIREINEFRVRCTNFEQGCKWVGELQSVNNHLESDSGCRLVHVICNNEAYTHYGNVLVFGIAHVVCGAEMERGHLADHLGKKCRCRQYACEYCGYVDTYDAIAGTGEARNLHSKVTSGNHYNTCENFPLKCVNGCGEKNIRRKDMKSHQKECPLEKIKCPFDSRCGADILRKDMETHKKECDFRPHTCEYCGHVGAFYTMSGTGKRWRLTDDTRSHYGTCEYYPLECVNKCGELEIKRRDMKNHCKVCPMQPLDCPYSCTHGKVLQRDMDKHKNEECENRPSTCQYCNTRGIYRSINGKGESGRSHYDVCDHYPLDCPNECGAENIKRKDMSLHRDKCVLEPLDCPFRYAGCNTHPILRKDMDVHCQRSMQNHLLLMAKLNQELVIRNQELVRKSEALAKMTNNLASKNEELTRKVEELTVKTEKMGKQIWISQVQR